MKSDSEIERDVKDELNWDQISKWTTDKKIAQVFQMLGLFICI